MSTTPLRSATPVSDVLEAELRRECSGGVLVWLDAAGTWTAFVDRLRDRETPPAFGLQAFRGSHLALMLALQEPTAGATPPVLVVHLPGFNEESIRETPLLGLYRSGKRYRKRLDTLVREAAAQRVAPARIEALLARDGLTLEDADRWLTEELAAQEGGFAAVLRDLSARTVIGELYAGGSLADSLHDPDARIALWSRMEAWLGLPLAWREAVALGQTHDATTIADTAVGWALAVEYVHDLSRPPYDALLQPAAALDRAIVGACCEIAQQLRQTAPDRYRRIATETAAMLADERKHARAEDLGKIDTFEFEEQKVLAAAVSALEARDWPAAMQWATHRLDATHAASCFWLQNDPRRLAAWQLVAAVATLGTRIEAAPVPRAPASWPELIGAYTHSGAPVDRAHRELEALAHNALEPGVPDFERLRTLQRTLWQHWQTWADAWAEATVSLGERIGFLPEPDRQQRSIFRQVVEPTLAPVPGGGRRPITAYLLVDAMRYEMATRVMEALSSQRDTLATLEARLAELPTNTNMGMNALAPVESGGRLTLRWANGEPEGMRLGQTTVRNPETRRAAIAARAGGASCPLLTFADILHDGRSLRHAVQNAKLVVVHNAEIDKGGESALGLDAFERVLRDLVSVWRLLRDAGVTRFVITADHGFLLNDPQRAPQSWGTRGTASRRSAYSDVPMTSPDTVTVPAASLNYDGVDGAFVFPRSTVTFDTLQPPGPFVHGGPSLQERVIPVLTIRHREPMSTPTGQYRAQIEVGQALGEFQKLRIRVERLGALSLGYQDAEEVSTVVRAVDAPSVVVRIEQVIRGGRVDAGRLLAVVGEEAEVFVTLRGPSGMRVQLEVAHVERAAALEPARTREFLNVQPSRLGESAVPATSPTPNDASRTARWLDGIDDEGARAVLAHLAEHGSVSEAEVVRMCGSTRRMRSFSLALDKWLPMLPFGVRVETAATGKRWVREGAVR